jgi:bifunctional ADP-heptose synthase (sugar kinase/adenylyltransferase)
VGDTILDDYQYCTPLGKSSKDPVLTVLHQSGDLFAGGILAVANHVANFSDRVDLVTVLGDGENQEAFIRGQLHPHVRPNFFYQKDAPTITKRRFVDGYSFNKLFEVYLMNDAGLSDDADDDMCRFVEAHLPDYDLVMVADYGHGALSNRLVRVLCEGAGFLAVNAQSNSGNRGFHTVTRYPRADYVCMAEHEIRLEMRQRSGSIHPMMKKLSRDLGAKQVVVTRGRNGCLVVDGKSDFVAVPAFARSVVDRVGAGDAFLSITAMASVLKLSGEPLGFIGNVVGALAVETIGNKKAVDKLSLKKNIVSLLK